jgi:hypothetical protein
MEGGSSNSTSTPKSIEPHHLMPQPSRPGQLLLFG